MRLILWLSTLVCAWSALAEEPLHVLVTIKPIHSLASSVMDGVATPELLIEGGQSPHNFNLRPSDAQKIAKATLIFWVGEGLETPLSRSLGAQTDQRQVITLMHASGIYFPAAREGSGWEARHGEHDHAQDPHIWLSPRNAEAIVQILVDELSRNDPANRERYFANGLRTTIRLRQLDRALRHLTKPVCQVPYLVFHDAYQHFDRRYRLNAVGSVTLGPDRTPGASHLMALRDKIGDQGVRCIFSEPQFQPKLVETLLKGTQARSGVLDPIGADLPAGKDAYFQLMENLALSLRQCLSSESIPDGVSR